MSRIFLVNELAVVLLTIPLLSGCAWEFSRDAEAVILEGTGSVVSGAGASEQASPIQPGAHVASGKRIRTGPAEHISVSLLPGALLDLGSDSELRLVKIRITKNGNRVQEAMRRAIAVELTRGSASVTVQFETQSSPVELKTARAVVGVVGPALFRVSPAEEKIRVTCARGNLRIRGVAERDESMIAAPALQEFPSPNSETVPAEFDLAATEEIENLREVERKLLGLQYGSRLAPYPWRQ